MTEGLFPDLLYLSHASIRKRTRKKAWQGKTNTGSAIHQCHQERGKQKEGRICRDTEKDENFKIKKHKTPTDTLGRNIKAPMEGKYCYIHNTE